MTVSNRQAVMDFVSQKLDRHGNVEGASQNISYRGNVIKSYNWTMAYRLGEDFFLKNGDTASPTTGQHQGIVQQLCPGPTLSFSALRGAGIEPSHMRKDDFIETVSDELISIHKRQDSEMWRVGWNHENVDNDLIFQTPKYGMVMSQYENHGLDIAIWHMLGTSLIEYESRVFLCSMDSGSYFVSELPGRPEDIEAAYQMLKPKPVVDAEEKGIDVKRQGEWFFIELDISDRTLATILEIKTLKEFRSIIKARPLEPRGENNHIARWVIDPDGYVYAKGTVYHRDRWGNSTGQHPPLHLGNVWHAVFRNTAIQSWSVGGRFD